MIFGMFCVMTLFFTYPLVRCISTCVPNPGDPLLNSWILAWDTHKLTTDASGFFDANIFYPYANTLAYSESQPASALLAMPVLLITQNPVLAHNWFFLFSFAVSGFGTYLLVEHLTKNALAGVVSGMIFAFCQYKIAHFTQIQMLATQWMPFALLFLDKWMHGEQWRDLVGFTVFFNLQALSSYYYALFFAIAVAVLLLYYLLKNGKRLRSKRLFVQFVCFGVLTLFINLPLAIPYFELSRAGFVRTRDTTRLFRATLTDYMATTPWNRFYGSLTAPLRGDYWSEHVFFPGIVALILALLGGKYCLFPPKTERTQTDLVGAHTHATPSGFSAVLPYACLVVLSMILAMGTFLELPGTSVRLSMPFGWLVDHVPGFQGLRVPSRINVITMLALAVMSGFGVSELQKRLRGTIPGLPKHILLMIPLLIAAEYASIPLPYSAVVPSQVPEVYEWLAGVEEDAVVIELPFASTTDGSTDWSAFPYIEGWRVYFSTYHWKSIVNGYSGFLPPGYAELVQDMSGFPDESSVSRLNEIGVNYVLLHREMWDAERREFVEQSLKAHASELSPVAEFGEVAVLRVVPQGGQVVRSLLKTATFEEKMLLIGFGVDKWKLQQGESFTMSLLWRALGDMEEDYTVYVHLLDGNGNLVGQHDSQPQGGKAPTRMWYPGQVVRDQHRLTVSPDAHPGSYRVAVGVYLLSTMERLSLTDHDGQILDDKVLLMEIDITEE
jgi:hypothetical protein